jgi:hypothetical protein
MGLPIIGTVADAVGSVIGKIGSIIDNVTTTDDERNKAKNAALTTLMPVAVKALELEAQIAKAQSDIIIAEAQGASWLQRSWRPITMLTFVGLVVARWFGLVVPNLSPEVEAEVFSIIKLGLGGYVIGRSAEKIVPGVIQSLKSGSKNGD